ncbi:MAG: hypothetical protein ABI216_21945 [Devosia sp.]
MIEEKFEGVVLWAPERHPIVGDVFFKIIPCKGEDYISSSAEGVSVSGVLANPEKGVEVACPIIFLRGQSAEVAMEYLKPGAFVSGEGSVVKSEFIKDSGEVQTSIGFRAKFIDFRAPNLKVERVNEKPSLERDHSYEM